MTTVERRKWYLCNSNQSLRNTLASDNVMTLLYVRMLLFPLLVLLKAEPPCLLFFCCTMGKGSKRVADLPVSLRQNFLMRMLAHNRPPWKCPVIAPPLNNLFFLSGQPFLDCPKPSQGYPGEPLEDSGVVCLPGFTQVASSFFLKFLALEAFHCS